jgi:hypothetical protein
MDVRNLQGGIMITTEASLYGQTEGSGSGVTTLLVCSCGQEIGANRREHCPRCGCSLS